MNNIQILETLSRIIDKLHNAMDEIEDIADNEIPKSKAQHYLFEAEMEINGVIDEFETIVIINGNRSGAV
jgi:hypothetical protein